MAFVYTNCTDIGVLSNSFVPHWRSFYFTLWLVRADALWLVFFLFNNMSLSLNIGIIQKNGTEIDDSQYNSFIIPQWNSKFFFLSKWWLFTIRTKWQIWGQIWGHFLQFGQYKHQQHWNVWPTGYWCWTLNFLLLNMVNGYINPTKTGAPLRFSFQPSCQLPCFAL